ncbi:MAG: nuclear transport factor 2 family protein [Oceanospirillaceae bacterium]|nr:nuclear transport factor 2 family protein [Oceanospirillaceae bacterium]
MTPDVLADQFAIQHLVYRYASAVDRRDAAALAACFANDMRLLGPGFEISRDVAEAVIGGVAPFSWTMHNVHNLLYQVQGDQARGEAYCVASHLQSDGNKLDWYIRYQDRLVRQKGEWLFAERRLNVECTTTVPVAMPGAGT